jgi:radical SAM protein with 4Fe4S-binding SPASM domain
MYYGLKDTTRLRKEKACTVIFSVEETGQLKYTHPVQAFILSLCDGERTGPDIVRMLTDGLAYERTKAEALFDSTLKDLHDFVEVLPSRVPLKRRRYDPVDFVYRPEGDPDIDRLSGPIEIAWMVTYRCPFDCVYCCVPTVSMDTPQPGELTTEQAMAFVEDCVRTGVATVRIHGGEPFIREDLPELIRVFLANDIHVMASTKLPLKEKVVARLAEIGLPDLQLSLDSTDDETASRLVARPNFLRGFWHNVDLLQRYGVEPKANVVVTSLNIDHIPTLIRDCAARGVRKFGLSNYLRSPHKHKDSYFASRDKLYWLEAQTELLRNEIPGVKIDDASTMSTREMSLCSDGLSTCSGGKTGFVVGGDGGVSFCDRLIGNSEAIVGNIKEASLLDIWYGYELKQFIDPPPEKFVGTACGTCSMMSACNKRTRCYYRVQIVDKKFYGPDYHCPKVPEPAERFF